MSRVSLTVPVVLLDGLLASGSSVISTHIGQSYAFSVINGNQYLRDLGKTTGYVSAAEGTLAHEVQLLDFYEYIVEDGVDVHDQMYSFLTSKISIAKVPTVVHCTGFAAYALAREIPVKKTFWLHATLEDRVARLLARHGLTPTEQEIVQIKRKLEHLDDVWDDKLKSHLGVELRAPEKQQEFFIDTANLTTEQAFQKLAMLEDFIETYNEFSSLLPEYTVEWRRWHCLNCELVLETNKVISQCPRCGNNDPNKFVDAD